MFHTGVDYTVTVRPGVPKPEYGLEQSNLQTKIGRH